MSDEDAPTFEPPRAAIPSRAAGTPIPPVPSPLPPVVEAAPRVRRARGLSKKQTTELHKKNARNRKKMSGKLPAREIKRITTNRRKNLAKKAAKRAVAKTAKNPNRPLELKTRMGAVLTAVASMSKADAAMFAIIMQHMEDMSRSGRRNVLVRLQQVYG